jgi:hypothetical protein
LQWNNTISDGSVNAKSGRLRPPTAKKCKILVHSKENIQKVFAYRIHEKKPKSV